MRLSLAKQGFRTTFNIRCLRGALDSVDNASRSEVKLRSSSIHATQFHRLQVLPPLFKIQLHLSTQ